MNFRDTLICFLCLLLGIGLLWCASTRLSDINNSREEMGLVSNEALENAPPSLAFATVAMGAFRGLVVDILWMRADKLKEEGQFFDAKQLAEWITILQPRFASVWDFHAWNLAYNISVVVPAHQWEERWRWVRTGYELLRDKGIEKNPRSMLLYHSLAWIFQHKIGGINDDAHRHYKRELAFSMYKLLGEDPDDEYFETMIATPKDMPALMADETVAELIEALKKSDSRFNDESEFVNNYLSLRQNPDKFDAMAHDVINIYRQKDSLGKLDIFCKTYSLRNDWKLDPEFMHKLNKEFGPVMGDPNDRVPLNWAHPNTHAIYWAKMGLDKAGSTGDYTTNEKNTDRIVFHSLQNLFHAGKLIFYPVPDGPASVFMRPDLRMFESCDKAEEDRIEKYGGRSKYTRSFMTGHRNLLKRAVLLSYQSGHVQKAGKIYNKLRRLYMGPELKVPVAVFVRNEMLDTLSDAGITDVQQQVASILNEGYFRYAVHDDDEAYGREKLAREIYDHYQQSLFDSIEIQRVGLPSFSVIKAQAIVSFMSDPMFPAYLKRNLQGRISVERPDLYEELQRIFDEAQRQNQ